MMSMVIMGVWVSSSTFYWGFDITPEAKLTLENVRKASPDEIKNHIELLRQGRGKNKKLFKGEGWTFRKSHKVSCLSFKFNPKHL